MAFNPLTLTQIARIVGVTWYDYVTTDTNATVAAAGYFNTFANQFTLNDKIWVKASDFSVLYYVSAVTRPVNIQGVVAANTAAASVTVTPITATAGSGLAPSSITGGPLSVVGRSVNSAGADADISATAASAQVLRESGSTIGWGTINDLASFGTNVYSTGSWTPEITFVVPGDLSVVYSNQVGNYFTVGKLVFAQFQASTSTFSHTTASGQMRLTGLPFTAHATNIWHGFAGNTGNVTFTAGYTQLVYQLIAATTTANLQQIGTGVTVTACTTANFPTATNYTVRGTLIYQAA